MELNNEAKFEFAFNEAIEKLDYLYNELPVHGGSERDHRNFSTVRALLNISDGWETYVDVASIEEE